MVMLDRLGGDLRAVSAMLGHSSVAITSDVYGAAADDARRTLGHLSVSVGRYIIAHRDTPGHGSAHRPVSGSSLT